MPLTDLQSLEAESIHIFREVAAECEKPVMLYSIGKDSSVLLHLARKAFYPAKPPFALMHIDTQWKFRDMIEFRDRQVKEYGLELIVYTNPQGLAEGINPFDHGSGYYTDVMKTRSWFSPIWALRGSMREATPCLTGVSEPKRPPRSVVASQLHNLKK